MKKNWLDTIEYPFTAHYFNLSGHNMHYIDEGEGETLLFVHGTPSWSFDFRHVIKALRTNYRCMAIDHIGFGLSDKPADYDYGTQHHSANLEQFILAKDLKDITLIVHDFGGPIGLNFAIRHPERIKRIVVLNSWMWNCSDESAYIKLRPILKSPLLSFLYKNLNFSARYLMPASFGDTKLDKKTHRQYLATTGKPSERNGLVAFAKSLLNDQEWFESLWQKRDKINNKPTLLIWGLKDKFLPVNYLEKFKSGFPEAAVERLENCGHFPQEEKASEVAWLIQLFLLDKTVQSRTYTSPL
jgi:pimeloyl-ACP methyl ester carboxylesterase